MNHKIIVRILQCKGDCGNVFKVILERTDDLTMSHISDTGLPEQEGYAVIRDRALVRCPNCQGLCRILPEQATIDVIKR